MIFEDRTEAGTLLAEKLEKFRDEHPVILTLPRGGLPIGYEISKALDAPLDIILVRKIGAPDSPELAIGAVVDGDEPELVLNERVVALYNFPDEYLEEQKQKQLNEIERRRKLYLADRSPINVEGKTAIIVDDGIATGSTALAAVHALKRKNPKRVVIAVPVAPAETIQKFEQEVDEVICLHKPTQFFAIGAFYDNFDQLTDEDVINILNATDG